MEEQKKEYTGVWIPAFVMEANLPPMAKLLYAEIASFKKCFASNAFFAERLNITERAVQKNLHLLKADGYILTGSTASGRRALIAKRDELKFTPPRTKVRPPTNSRSYIDTKIDTKKETISSASQTELDRRSRSEAPTPPAPLPSLTAENTFRGLVAILHPGQKILFTPGRKSKLNARLKNFDQKQLCDAAKNLMQDPWNTGKNPTNKKYASFDFLIRNDEMVEKWLNEKPVTAPKSAF